MNLEKQFTRYGLFQTYPIKMQDKRHLITTKMSIKYELRPDNDRRPIIEHRQSHCPNIQTKRTDIVRAFLRVYSICFIFF